MSNSEEVTAAALASMAPPGQLGDDVKPRFVSLRSILIACALMPIMAIWVVSSELIWYSGHSTTISLFFHVTFVIFLLALLNLVVEHKWPRHALTPGELMTIYMMLSVGSTFCSHDLLQIMIPMLGYPAYFANPQNGWANVILNRIPSWAYLGNSTPSAGEAMTGLAVGNSTIYDWGILLAWAKPLAFWGTFLLALMGALLTINIFFRLHWTEREKLSFPVIQIPLLIATNLRSLLTNKLFWIAFGITASIDILNGFQYLYPNLPAIPIVKAFTFADYFTERPWNAIAATEINLYPFVIGLVFFMPVDLAFSCWFFYLFFQLQRVLTSAIGITDLPGFPFPNEQAAGGYIALGLLAIWLSRKHLKGVFRKILGLPGGTDDSAEPMSYRAALVIFLTCFVVLIVEGVMLTRTIPEGQANVTGIGYSIVIMIAFFIIFFLYSIAIARMRAELGPPAHDLHNMGPDAVIHNALGTHGLGYNNVAAFTMFFWFNRAYRAHFSAHSMEGFKLAQLTRLTSRSMMYAMLVAIVVGILAAFWALLHLLTVHGYSGRPAGDAFSAEAWNKMAAWLSFPQRPKIAATLAVVVGFGFSILLGGMRMRFTWWLWHPVGYATSTSWSMGKLWFCMFLGWLVKALIIRYGGAQLYRKAMPFFIGLVMGEFVVGSLWLIYGDIVGVTVYRFWG